MAGRYTPVQTMLLDLWRKDMRVFADALACPMPVCAAAVPLLNAAIASGFSAEDAAAVCAVGRGHGRIATRWRLRAGD